VHRARFSTVRGEVVTQPPLDDRPAAPVRVHGVAPPYSPSCIRLAHACGPPRRGARDRALAAHIGAHGVDAPVQRPDLGRGQLRSPRPGAAPSADAGAAASPILRIPGSPETGSAVGEAARGRAGDCARRSLAAQLPRSLPIGAAISPQSAAIARLPAASPVRRAYRCAFQGASASRQARLHRVSFVDNGGGDPYFRMARRNRPLAGPVFAGFADSCTETTLARRALGSAVGGDVQGPSVARYLRQARLALRRVPGPRRRGRARSAAREQRAARGL
jgi:hypothetical protein